MRPGEVVVGAIDSSTGQVRTGKPNVEKVKVSPLLSMGPEEGGVMDVTLW